MAQVDGGLAHVRPRGDARPPTCARSRARPARRAPPPGSPRRRAAERGRPGSRLAGTSSMTSLVGFAFMRGASRIVRPPGHFFTSRTVLFSSSDPPEKETRCPPRAPLCPPRAGRPGVVQPKRVLIVVANPGVSTTLGWPVGFWAAELTHPLLRAHRARRRGDDREPGRGQGRVRRLQRPPRRLELVVGGPHHDGLHQHAGLHGAAREHARGSPTSTSTPTTR